MRPSTSSRAQSGQVLVIVAALMVAMIGMLGLAIDGGRIYIERRLLQNSADAAALGAADAYAGWIRAHTGDTAGAATAAFAAGANEYGDMVQGSAVSADTSPPGSLGDCSGNKKYASSGGAFRLWLDEITPVHSHDASARVFRACVSDSLSMAFIQVLNGIASTNVVAEAEAISAQSIPAPGVVLFILDPSNVSGPAPCGSGSPKNSLQITGGGSLEVNGSIVSDGNINSQNNTNLSVYLNGQMFDHCDTSFVTGGNVCWITTAMPSQPPPCGASSGTSQFQQTTTFPDPLGAQRLNWAASSNWFGGVDSGAFIVRSPTDTNFTNTVELQPGEYTDDPFPSNTGVPNPGVGGQCWFEEPGIYQWDKGLSGHSGLGLVSNELAPPAGVTSGSALPNGENPPFSWNGGGSGLTQPGSAVAGSPSCAGSFATSSSSCGGLLSPCAYYLRVASAREDKALGGLTTGCASGCWRQSYLSNTTSGSGCLPISLTSATSVQVAISNVPGMGNTPGTGTSPGVAAATDTNETLLGSRYDIFASSSCTNADSKWVYVGSANFSGGTGTQTLAGLPSCPSLPAGPWATTNKFLTNGGCGLGYVASPSMNLVSELGAVVPTPGSTCSLSAPTPPVAGVGACSPSYLGNTVSAPGGSPDLDVANEHYCVASVGGGYCEVTTPSPKDDSPGGVLYYMPSTIPVASSCLDTSNKGLQHYVYGNDELYDVVFYAPNNCSAHITGGFGGEFTGWAYMPGSSNNLTLDGQGVPFNGGLDVWDLTIAGGGNLYVPGGIPTFTTVQPLGARLLICTNTTPFCTGTP